MSTPGSIPVSVKAMRPKEVGVLNSRPAERAPRAATLGRFAAHHGLNSNIVLGPKSGNSRNRGCKRSEKICIDGLDFA